MLPAKALLVALPLAAAAGWVTMTSAARVRVLADELATADGAGQEAAAAVARLEPHAVERELAAFDRRRGVTAELARARRSRVLGALGLATAGLVLAGLTVFARLAAEAERARRVAALEPPPGPEA